MQVKNVVLCDLKGEPLKINPNKESERLTVAECLQAAALAQPVNPQDHRDAKNVLKRYMFAMEMEKLSVDEMFELDLDFYMSLRPDLMRIWTVVVAGQVMQLVEPK